MLFNDGDRRFRRLEKDYKSCHDDEITAAKLCLNFLDLYYSREEDSSINFSDPNIPYYPPYGQQSIHHSHSRWFDDHIR